MGTHKKPASKTQGNNPGIRTKSANMLRTLTMLKKNVIRVVRRAYPTRRQYPSRVPI